MSAGDEQEPAEDGNGNREENGSAGGIPDATGSAPENNQADEEALRYNIARLSDENEGIRWQAAESLGRLEDPAAVDALIDALWDDEAPVRIKAAWALGRIGDPRALRPLQQLYRIENENVREIIERAMDDIKRRMSGG